MRLQELKKQVRRKCKKCHKVLEMRIDFQLSKNLKTFIDSKSGVWLEWYVWKLLSAISKNIGHNVIWSVEGKQTEIDVEINSKKQPTAILCDTKSDPTFNIEKFHLIAKKYKRLVLVTTQKKVQDKIVDAAKEHFSQNVVVIKGTNLENGILSVIKIPGAKKNKNKTPLVSA